MSLLEWPSQVVPWAEKRSMNCRPQSSMSRSFSARAITGRKSDGPEVSGSLWLMVTQSAGVGFNQVGGGGNTILRAYPPALEGRGGLVLSVVQRRFDRLRKSL